MPLLKTNEASKVAFVGITEDYDARMKRHFEGKNDIVNDYKSKWDHEIISKLKFNNCKKLEDLEKF